MNIKQDQFQYDTNHQAIMRIGLDFSSLDQATPKGGQYRYVVDLVRGLSELNQDKFQFFLFGSNSEPVPELQDIFLAYPEQWVYRQIKPWNFRGGYYLNYLRYAAIAYFYRLHLWHTLHSFIPLLASCKIIITEYDLMYELFDEYQEAVCSRPYQINKWGVQNRVDHVITISESTTNDLEQRWEIPIEKISTVQLGANLPNLNALVNSKTLKLEKEIVELTLLSPFNLEPRKNLHSLLLVMPQLLTQYPSLRLILFGRAACTPEREREFNNLISELNIKDQVICMGFVEDERLAELYYHCTVFVFPSLYEGFGLPILEAMSMGACVVARNAASMAEIVSNTGVLIENCDPDELTLAISKLLENEPMRRKLSEAAKERAKDFSIQNMASKTLKVYEEILVK